MKKNPLLTLLCILTCLLLFLPGLAIADHVSGDWQYTLNEEGQAIVTRYQGTQSELKMPWNLDGHVIVEIGEEAFSGNSALQSIQLPVGVKVIRMNAFMNCTSLQEVALPMLLETIEDYAFLGCTALSSVNLPDSVAELGEECFERTTRLTGSANSLASGYAQANDMDYGTEDIAPPAVEGKKIAADYQYRIENGGVTITSYTGEDYEVFVPAEIDGYPVRIIGSNAFSSRYGVERVVLPEGLTKLEKTAFRYCPALSSIQLPSTLVEIGESAFYRCEYLQEIQLPEGLTKLGNRAFQGCSQLRDVTLPASLTSIPYYAFFECHASLTIYAPKGSAAERFASSRGYRFTVTED